MAYSTTTLKRKTIKPIFILFVDFFIERIYKSKKCNAHFSFTLFFTNRINYNLSHLLERRRRFLLGFKPKITAAFIKWHQNIESFKTRSHSRRLISQTMIWMKNFSESVKRFFIALSYDLITEVPGRYFLIRYFCYKNPELW